MTRSKQRRLGDIGLGVSFVLALSGCAGFGNLGDEPGIAHCPGHGQQPADAGHGHAAAGVPELIPDIKINMIFMEENDLRNAATKDVATKGGQYDIVTVGAYEVPISAKTDGSSTSPTWPPTIRPTTSTTTSSRSTTGCRSMMAVRGALLRRRRPRCTARICSSRPG